MLFIQTQPKLNFGARSFQQFCDLTAGVQLMIEQYGMQPAGHAVGPVLLGFTFENRKLLGFSGRQA